VPGIAELRVRAGVRTRDESRHYVIPEDLVPEAGQLTLSAMAVPIPPIAHLVFAVCFLFYRVHVLDR
jgi:hypothetical protein